MKCMAKNDISHMHDTGAALLFLTTRCQHFTTDREDLHNSDPRLLCLRLPIHMTDVISAWKPSFCIANVH